MRGALPVPPRRLALQIALLALLALAAAGCRVERVDEPAYTATPRPTAGEPRSFRLGFSSLPARLDDDAHLEALNIAALYGDLLLIQRSPSWAEFLPGVAPSDELLDLTQREVRAIEERRLTLFYAIDPYDPGDRGRLAAPPEGYERSGLLNPDLSAAIVTEARFIAGAYQPAYLAFGVEVNATYDRSPGAYLAYLGVYREVYDAVKEVSPETLVFPTFQYEQLLGVTPWEVAHAPRWERLADFGERLDLVAIATIPSLTQPVARTIPPDYYRQLQQHTDLPIAFAATGFSSAPGPGGINSSTPPEQRRYLQRLFADAEAMQSPFVIWFASRDPEFVSEIAALEPLGSIGLLDTGGEPKEAWPVWAEAAQRPYQPPGNAE